jgi:hypothetical protein
MPLQISDDYIDKLVALFENIRDNQFEIGDTLTLLVDSSPEQRQDIMNYVAGKLAVSPSTLYDYENTARRWTPDKRQEYAALDYTIYRNSDPVKDKELLDKAIDEGWNATTFKEAMYPALVEPSNQIMRVMRILQKILKETIPPAIETEIRTILNKLSELHAELDDEF